ncbi:MAG: NUDIX domain-containing protein [Pseudomonadota bacterium]
MMMRFIPAPLHRALLPIAHRMRMSWRRWRGTPFAGVSAVVTNLSGDVLLVRHSYGADVWSLPGGGLGNGEDPEAGLRRELTEELGLAIGAVTSLGSREEVLFNAPHTAHLFTATCNSRPKPDGREVIEARFFPSHSLPEPLSKTTAARIAIWRERAPESQS